MQTATNPTYTPPMPQTPEVPQTDNPAIIYRHAVRFTMELEHTEDYYPTPRHKKAAQRRFKANHTFFINYAQRSEAPIVLVECQKSTTFVYRMYQGKLYREAKECNDQGIYRATKLENVVQDVAHQNSPWCSLEKNSAAIETRLERFVVVAGRIYEQHQEPRYDINRNQLEIEHGEPETPYSYLQTYNALEYHAALESIRPRLTRRQSRNSSRIINRLKHDSERKQPKIWVLDPRAVQIPSHEEYVERYEVIQITRAVNDLSDRLRSHHKPRVKRILERLLELQNT